MVGMFVRPLNTRTGNLTLPINVMTIHHFLSPIAIAAALLISSVDMVAIQN